MLNNKIIVPRIETHVSHACNLKCDNCNHFSNFKVKSEEIITAELFKQWNEPWTKKIIPHIYQLCGGEPTLNNHLTDICYVARKLWNKSKILLISNGFFLKNHPNLPEALEANNIKLIISIHDDSEEYLSKIEEIKTLISFWKKHFNFEIEYRESYLNWFKTFKTNEDGKTVPYNDNNPIMSFEKCLSKNAKQLFNGLLFKCPPLAYLNLINKKFKLEKEWNYYLEYEPLKPNCTYNELINFFSIKHENYCNMCASNPTQYKKPNPLIQLKVNF